MYLTIRAFADDFAAAATRRGGAAVSPQRPLSIAAVSGYIDASVVVVDANGHRAPISVSGTRQTGDLLWITARVPSVRDLRGVRLSCALLFERFDDQVNIVQAALGGARHSLLFTRGDGRSLKALSS